MIDNLATKKTNSVLDMIQYYDLKKYLLENNISNNYLKKIHSFILCLPDGEFEVVNLIRIVPNRRLVLLAKDLAKNINVIIKLFFNNRKYHKDYKLLTDGYNLLIQHGLLTPKIIFTNLNSDLKQSYVITEYIQSHNITGLYIKAVADLHKNFLYQKDLHLNNFLIDKNNYLYYLDCETIVYDAKLIKSKKAYDNFALFLTQIKNISQNELNNQIKQYLNFLNITSAKLQLDINKYICQSVDQQLNTRIRKFILKTRRNCTDYIVLNQKNINFFLSRKFYNLHKNFFDEFTASPNKFIDRYKIDILKQGNTAHVYLINYHGLKLVIKNYLYRSVFKKIKYLFKKPRCVSSWENANLLKNLNIKTPDPIASMIFKKHGLIEQSYFIMGYDDAYKSLASSMANKKPSAEVFSKLMNMLGQFKLLYIAHRDFKTANLGLVGDDLFVLDLDAMKIYKDNFIGRMLAHRAHLKDVKRLFKCW